jgi:hypothetical protein
MRNGSNSASIHMNLLELSDENILKKISCMNKLVKYVHIFKNSLYVLSYPNKISIKLK